MEPLFILALFAHGYKARTSTLYHLLKGKRTTSVLLYGFQFNTLRFFQLFPTLSEEIFMQHIQWLVGQGFLKTCLAGEVQLTAKGKLTLTKETINSAAINSYRFGKTDQEMWRMLQFSVQVVSQLSARDRQYLPLEHSLYYQKQLKRIICKYSKEELVHTVRNEWTTLFEELTDQEATFLAKQFSGYQQIGKTIAQLAPASVSNFEHALFATNTLHQLLQKICDQPNSLLYQFITPFLQQNKNHSMNQTNDYFRQGLSVEELAEKRQLKKATIQDHLLELALLETFPFDRYITKETERMLVSAPNNPEEWVYREEKQKNTKLDYFQFRLVQIKQIKEKRAR